MSGHRNPYQILNVSADAEPIVIEAAYKALIKKYHPDLWLRNPDAQSRAAAINESFALLRDAEARAHYDHQLRSLHNAAQLRSFRQQQRAPRKGARWWLGWLVAAIVIALQFVPWDGVTLPNVQLASRPAPATASAAPQEKGNERAGVQKQLPESLLRLLDNARDEQAAFLAGLDDAAEPDPAQTPAPALTKNGQKRQGAPAPAAEKLPPSDFLEREGYIY